MARPRKIIDPDQVKRLAAIGCPASEIAAELGVHRRTIERRYAAVLKEGLERRNTRVRNTLFKQAMAGNTAILIFLGKVWLHMKAPDENALTVNVSASANARAEVRTPEQIKAHLLDLQKAVREEAKRLELN